MSLVPKSQTKLAISFSGYSPKNAAHPALPEYLIIQDIAGEFMPEANINTTLKERTFKNYPVNVEITLSSPDAAEIDDIYAQLEQSKIKAAKIMEYLEDQDRSPKYVKHASYLDLHVDLALPVFIGDGKKTLKIKITNATAYVGVKYADKNQAQGNPVILDPQLITYEDLKNIKVSLDIYKNYALKA
ncbi:hypothetical protein [Fluviispira vulneris]|uniref:hypothetical protein n=1 Tax=Fluviispira vulneris TaxID=2763012 RepID=UPI0016490885|nr:hypothetical protein [Fluviispira vulneris]